MPMNLVALKKPAGYGQHPAPKIHGRSSQPQLVPAGLNYLESIMTFTPRNEHFLLRERYQGRYKRWGNKTLISGWFMVMSRDIISKNSLSKGHFPFKPWRKFFRWVTVTSKLGDFFAHFSHPQRSRMLQMPRTGWSLFRTRRRWVAWRILEDLTKGNTPADPTFNECPPEKRWLQYFI